MSVEQGWSALARGDARAAQDAFARAIDNDPQNPRAVLGMARALLMLGEVDQAEMMSRMLSQLAHNFDSEVLAAQVLSHRGRRSDAVNTLKLALNRNPQDAFARALLAEQRLRQGYWDEGTDLLIAALTQDPQGEGFAHARTIISDMIEAASARKIRMEEALKFVNRVDYSVPKKRSDIATFFAEARRALNSGSPMPSSAPKRAVATSSTPIAPASPRAAATTRREPSRPAPQPRPKPSQDRSVTHAAAKLMNQDDRLELAEMRVGSRHQAGFIASIREERKLNQELQATLDPLERPSWPSRQKVLLDTIPSLNFEGQSITEKADSLGSGYFHVTDGSLFSQIYMERCLVALMRALPDELIGTIGYTNEHITRLELNLGDGMFRRMATVHTSDMDNDIQIGDVKVVALGTFLGRCLERDAGGTWEYAPDAMRSTVRVKKQTYNPMELAKRWFDAEDKNDVDLHEQVTIARDSIGRLDISSRRSEHIDDTLGSTGAALMYKIAELWSVYRAELIRVTAAEISANLTELWSNDSCVVFRMPARLMPASVSMFQKRAQLPTGGYVVAHIRKTGEFLLLGHRKDFARLLPWAMEDLDEQSSRMLLRMLKKYHLPGAVLVDSQQAARTLSERTGTQLQAPSLRRTAHGQEMTTQIIFDKKLSTWVISQNGNEWTFTRSR